MFDYYSEAKALQGFLTERRRDLHQHPELPLEEFRTAQVLEQQLDELNIPHQRIGATGVLGILKGELPGSGVIALRADIDALPIQEANEVSYRSVNDNVMHACGHDAHTTCLLGGVKILAAHRSEFGGEVRIIFQPAEEIGRGADDFISAGVMDGVQRVFGLHTAHEIPAGTVSLTPGLNNAGVDQFKILIHGKGAHVSTPELGSDAVYIGSHIVTALQALVTRRTSPVEAALIGVGTFNAGTAYNVVAEEAELIGTTRTITEETQMRFRKEITETSQRIAALYGATAEVIWTPISALLYNNASVCDEAIAALTPGMPGVNFMQERPFSLGGDNMADYLHCAPGAYAYLGSGNDALPGTLNAAHNCRFDIDESVLPIGAALYAGYAAWWLEQG